jgi:hypothetical protein
MTNKLLLWSKQLYRLPMNVLLRDLVKWKPQAEPESGYSVVIACMTALAPVAVANLQLCARQRSDRLREIILVFDTLADEIPAEVREAAHATSPSVNVRLIGYSRHQRRIAHWINWGWVYSWMSWCLGIAHARTRAVIIHDLDAMPIGEGFFEQLFDHWIEAGTTFCGIRRYVGNGVTEEMSLVTTFELTLDAAEVRRQFRPYDLFNKIALVDGRVVDFDTMLSAQWRYSRPALRPIGEAVLVHPTQLICNYTDLISGRADFRGQLHVLLMLPYFLHLGGDSVALRGAGAQLAEESARRIELFGRELAIDGITPQHWAWMEKQIRRVEQALFGSTRPEAADYLAGFICRAGSHRTVGVEIGTNAVAER